MFLTLSDPVDDDRVGDLHHGVEDGGDEPQEEGDQHSEAETGPVCKYLVSILS